MIGALGLRSSSLRMVSDGKTLPPTAYSRPPGSRSRGTEAVVDPALVYKRYEEGATIILEGLQRFWEPLTFFCRDLELALGHRLQVNSYITPPGSQGFAAHSDDHDVFVLQVHGTKHWLVYDAQDPSRALVDGSLKAGDSLYIPRGFPHAGRTSDRASAHLTVGILTREARDIVREVLRSVEAQPGYRERLASEAASDPVALRSEVERVVGELRLWLDKVDTGAVTRSLTRRFMTTSQPLVRGQLRQLESLGSVDAGSRVRRRRGATCHLLTDEDGVTVLLADRELRFPLAALGAIRFVASTDSFTLSDLHDHLDPEGSLVVVRRLVREGLLEVGA